MGCFTNNKFIYILFFSGFSEGAISKLMLPQDLKILTAVLSMAGVSLFRTASASWWIKTKLSFELENVNRNRMKGGERANLLRWKCVTFEMLGYVDVTAGMACFGGADGQSISRTLYVIEVV